MKLSQNFSEAWSEMILGSEFGIEQKKARNKESAKKIIQKAKLINPELRIEALSNHVEIIHGGVSQSVCIQYDAENFEDTLRRVLRNYNIILK